MTQALGLDGTDRDRLRGANLNQGRMRDDRDDGTARVLLSRRHRSRRGR